MTTSAQGDPLSLVGKTLAGHFLVQSLAAVGYTSVVYRGEHIGPKRQVALKCLKITVLLDAARADTFLRRFREETRGYSQLTRNEPHFVKSIGTGMTATGNGAHVPYSVLEWLDGGTLAEDLRKRSAAGSKGRSLAEAVVLLAPTARALAAAHTQKLMHGDVSARNVFLTKNAQGGVEPKLLDFGVARVVRDVSRDLAPIGMTSTADDPFWIPSPGYAAPEQMDRALGDVGPWTDVYAFAIVFLETLRDQSLGTPPPALASLGLTLPEPIERVLVRALAKSPKERWPSVTEFWGAFEDALRVSAMAVPPRDSEPTQTMTIQMQTTMQLTRPVASSTPAATAPGKTTLRLDGGQPATPRVAKPPVPTSTGRAAPAAPTAAPAAAPVAPTTAPVAKAPASAAPPLPSTRQAAPAIRDTPRTVSVVPAIAATPPAAPSVSVATAPAFPVSAPPVAAPPAAATSTASAGATPVATPVATPPASATTPSENARSVSAAMPAARAQVTVEALPSVMVEAPPPESVIIAPEAAVAPPKRNSREEPTMQIGMQQVMPAGAQLAAISPSAPYSASGIAVNPPPAAHSGPLVMPGAMPAVMPSAIPGVPASRPTMSHEQRRNQEHQRFALVVLVSFVVVFFLVGAGVLALHSVKGNTRAAAAAAHSATN